MINGLMDAIDARPGEIRQAITDYLDKKLIIIWEPEDIISRAEELGHTIDMDDAVNILSIVESKTSSETGVTWDIIDIFIGDYAND